MNKQDYLNQLKQALSRLNEQEREAALSFCAEILEDRMESGMTEEEAVAKMETPAQMAEKLNVSDSRSDMFSRLFGAPVEKMFDQNNAPFSDEEKVNPTQWQQMQLTCDPTALNLMDLETSDMGIDVKLSKNEQVTLTYYTRPLNEHKAWVENGTLYLRETNKENQRRFFFSFFNFDCNTLKERITLEVPEHLMAHLKLKTRNGGISLTGPQMLMHTELTTTNGGLHLERVQCLSLTARTTNSGVKALELVAKKDLSLTSTNGNFHVENCQVQGEMTIHTSNSAIHLDHCRAARLTANTTNGPIKVNMPQADAISLSTTNGPVKGTLPGPQSHWQIESRTTNGSNSLPHHQQGQKPLSVHSTNGSIKLGFE